MEQSQTRFFFTLRWVNDTPSRRNIWNSCGNMLQQIAEKPWKKGTECPERPGQSYGNTKQIRADQKPQNTTSIKTLKKGPLVMLMDICPRMIYQTHIIHTTWACCLTAKTRQTTINMFYNLRLWSTPLFQHISYHPNTTTWRVCFITQNLKCWAGCCTKSTMHTATQNLR